jgi:hypothetical protein
MSTFGFGDNPVFARGRGSYANPHATIAIKDIPVQIRMIFRLCRFYYHQDALLGALVDKLSEYPITELVIMEQGEQALSDKQRDKWEHLLNVSMDLRSVLRQINIDKYVYGNSFHYLYYPFIRYCICQNCKHQVPIQSMPDITVKPTVKGKKFSLIVTAPCLSCSKSPSDKKQHSVEDRKSEARTGLTFTRMNPMRMFLEYNPMSGRRDWYWEPQQMFRDALLNGVRTIVDTTEMKILEAANKGQKVRLNKDRLWVAQADNTPGLWEGWGVPPLFRVLEDVYYYKILRRANEALAQEHVTPLRILTPAATGDVSPQRTMNLADWQTKLKGEILKFKTDPNHMIISPVPINVEQVGGQARVMMVATEMEAAARMVAMGLGCPVEMIWGGLNWSGASVSLRVLENHFINDRENSERLLKFIVPKLASYFRLPRIELRLSEFKMADDVQQQANSTNLMLQGFLSRESVINEMGYDASEEFTRLGREHAQMNKITMADNVAAAHMNTVIQALEAKAQVLLQYELQIEQQRMQAMAERQRLEDLSVYVAQVHAKGYATPLEFDQSSQMLAKMQPQMQQLILGQWAQSMPFVVQMLTQKIQNDQAAAMASGAATGAAGGMQQPGAAGGPQMQPGAAGPYGGPGGQEGGGTDTSGVLPGGPQVSGQGSSGQAQGAGPAQDALPEQRPPTREGGAPV